MPKIRVGALDLEPNRAPVKSWEPDRWNPRHAIVARLRGAGLKIQEIAEALDMSEVRVGQICNDERAKPYILEAQATLADNILDLNARLKFHSEEALSTIVDQMRNAEKEAIRQKAAFGILDRAGYTPIQKHTVAPPAPTLPEGLSELISEAHAEITETRRTIRFRAPESHEIAPSGVDLSELERQG